MTKHITNIFGVIAVLLIACMSCVEPFEIHSVDFDRALVVEGRFTNEQKPHYVKLSFTRPIDEKENVPVTKAEVWVEGSEGSRIDFEESAPGVYECEETAGLAGTRYQLFFITNEGRHYQSEAQELLESPPIDSIYDKYAERVSTKTDELQKGIQFFLSSHDDKKKAQNFKYEWEETYEVRAPYPSLFEFVDADQGLDSAILRDEPVHICYVTNRSSNIIIASTMNLSESRLAGMDLRYITDETDRLKYAYSILAKQYVISAEAYSFYREILKNNKGNGSFFDQQQGVVIGNIKCVEDPEETVLGFFEVSGVSEKRAFFKEEELDDRFPWPEDEYPCYPKLLRHFIDRRDSMTYYVKALGYGVTRAEFCDTARVVPPGGMECPFESIVDIAPVYCGDCRFRGTNIKPEFWIY